MDLLCRQLNKKSLESIQTRFQAQRSIHTKMHKSPIARPGQALLDHLTEAGELAGVFGSKLGLPISTKLLGTLHDVGKYSLKFQRYIQSIAGIISPEDELYLNPDENKGKIDHATAGAQWLWNNAPDDDFGKITTQMLALVIASHHSGLIDCLSIEGVNKFEERIAKSDDKSFYSEVLQKLPPEIVDVFEEAFLTKKCFSELIKQLKAISMNCKNSAIEFDLCKGLVTRLMLSCLVDADHSNSAGRIAECNVEWEPLCELLENKIQSFEQKYPIDKIRRLISDQCFEASKRNIGTYQLTVPTGGGKTLASLRFALNHAKVNDLERIFYIIPYTSIIDQNASEVRKILEPEGTIKQVVLEHHSNLTDNNDTDRNKLLSENWDSPVVFTTLVQFLETVFGSGTRGVRRMHRLSKAVIIFDEPQTLPINVIHMFNGVLNLLREQYHSTIVLCTATQPIFEQVDVKQGGLRLSHTKELVDDKGALFKDLSRVDVTDKTIQGGWSVSAISHFMRELLQNSNSILYIANTKASAKAIYESVKGSADLVVHLSTNMCPAHRRVVLHDLKQALLVTGDDAPSVICVSTQLIEAGVDISFSSVIRSLAGLDSIAQAAGRCNRHGECKGKGNVYILNPNFENLGSLEEMKKAQEETRRILREYTEDPAKFSHDLIGLQAMQRYYQLFYFERKKQMSYPFLDKLGRSGSVLNLLSSNIEAQQEHYRKSNKKSPLMLNQSFRTANTVFEAIEAATESVIVPYETEGREIIGRLCAEIWSPEEAAELRKKAQQYAVNIYPNVMKKLSKANAVLETSEGSGVYYLNETFYNNIYGLSSEGDGSLSFLNTE